VDPGAQLKRLLALAALALFLPSCAGHQVDLQALSSASDQVVWEAAQKAVAKKDWEAARQYFRRIIDAFPQSEHQADSRISLADSYFEEGGVGNYVLAVSSYREFLTLYPQHPKSDYAQFRCAESYYKQKNTPDRDQTATHQALDEYQRLLDVYPQSPFVEQTRARITECRQVLARSDFQVGFFYQKTRKSWRSAIGRYETIVSEYPDFEKFDEVLFRLAQCLAYSGRYAEARPQIGRLEAEFPQSPFIEEAKKLEASLPAAGVPAVNAPAPAGPPPQGKPANPPQSGPPPGRD
jgi:outer membrane assembly lipoprotein YfiO